MDTSKPWGFMQRHHVIIIPAVVSAILTIIGVLSVAISSSSFTNANEIYTTLAFLGQSTEYGYSRTHNHPLAIFMNFAAIFIFVFVVYWVIFKIYFHSKKRMQQK